MRAIAFDAIEADLTRGSVRDLNRQAGLLADVDRFRQQLGTLVRLALSAATQKRDHVRQAERGAELASGFLILNLIRRFVREKTKQP